MRKATQEEAKPRRTAASSTRDPGVPAHVSAAGGECVDPQTDLQFCGANLSCNDFETCTGEEVCMAGTCIEPDACEDVGTESVTVTVGEASGDATEGGDAVTYEVSLDTEPCADVTVTLTVDDQVTVGDETLVFTPESWDTPQTVSVTAVHDAVQEGDHEGTITHAVTSPDPRYAEATAGDVTITILDRARLFHVSVNASGAGADGSSRNGVVSSDGLWVAFQSEATDLVAGDTNELSDVFLYDVAAGTTTRISAGSAQSDGASDIPRITADGSHVYFRSAATNLTSDTVTGEGDWFVYTRADNTLALVSGQCTDTCNDAMGGGDIAADGSLMLYGTRRQLVVEDPETEHDIYAYDPTGDTTTLVSVNAAGENSTDFWGSNTFGPRLSANGRYMGFRSAAQNWVDPEITVQNFHAYVKDLMVGTVTRVSVHSVDDTNCDGTYRTQGSGVPYVSDDGNIAAFDSECPIGLEAGQAADDNDLDDVFVRNISGSTTTRVSVSSAGDQADGASTVQGISLDGRFVLFTSEATNLVAGDDNGATDAFLHDRNDGSTTRVSAGSEYEQIDGSTLSAALSRDGRFLVFSTTANLLPSDDNTEVEDVYLLQLR